MKIRFDTGTDALCIGFEEVPIKESREARPAVVLDYDAARGVMGLQVLSASHRVHAELLRRTDFEIAEPNSRG